MRVENARRLTGRGFFSPGPGAAVELWFEPGDDRDTLVPRWHALLDALLDPIGLGHAPRFHHLRDSGLTTAVRAPIDRLLALADLLEWAALNLTLDEPSIAEALQAYQDALAEQGNPALLALESVAATHAAPFLWDDDLVSLGLGEHARTFTPRSLPDPNALDWSQDRTIPVGLVTGTNGKTTTTRMVARILAEAGHSVGMSSTDAIAIAGVIAEEGDWTGPGAARKVLRNPSVTAAVLETARGGILRRGLAYERADAAVVTNIGADHFGDFGITALADMAKIKAVVWDGVRPGGKRIANAGCAISREHLATHHPDLIGHADWILFGRDEPLLLAHIAAGGEAWSVTSDLIRHHARGATHDVIAPSAIPATFRGAARHNVDNALAAAALAAALGASDVHIAGALGEFGRSPDDNAGRLERHTLDERTILLDFGHNPHGVRSLLPIVESLLSRTSGTRLMVVTGQAGDRGDADLADLAAAIMELGPARVAIRPMRGYERGRAPGEVESILGAALAHLGLPEGDNVLVADELDALASGLAWSRPGDLILVLVHIQRAEVRAWLDARRTAKRQG